MRTTITLFLMVFIKVSFGQCDTPIPTSAYTDTSLCQSWIECSRILWAESEDTLIWYKIDGADTAEVDRNRRGYSAPETSEPGFYKYAVSAKGECESKKLPLNVTILPYTPIEITEEVSINYYDTIAEVKALPPGGNFYVYESDPSIVILYSLACEMEGTPSQGEDSIFEVNITTFTPGWNHYYNYSYFNEYGCGSSTTKDINVLPPPRPNNPDTLVYMFSETNVSIVANSAPSCEIVWSYNSSPYNIIYIGDTLLLDQFLFWTNRIYAFQKFGEQYSEPKETVLIGVDCYAKPPKVESVIIEVPLGDTYPTISPTLTAEFETIHFFDYNQFQQGITVDLSTTNTYTPTKSEEICVIALDDRYGCYSPCQLVSVRTICNNVNTPIIDSIIQDTLYDEYENATIVVQNTREANQTCIWYIDDNLYVDEIADTLKYSFNKAITEVYVSIVDTVQKCQSESSNFIYKKINCDVDFTYPSMPTVYFGDTIPTLEMIAPGQHINWYLNYDSLVETGPSYKPIFTEAGNYPIKIKLYGGNCSKTITFASYVMKENKISGKIKKEGGGYWDYVAQSGQIIQILPHDEYITSNSSGQFMFAPKEYGTYTLRYIGNNRYERGESTRDTTITINDENHSYLNIFFFAKPKLVNDISIFSTVISRPIVGREMILQTTVKNWGETAYNIPIEINFSNCINYIESTNETAFVFDTTITYTIDSIDAQSYFSSQFTFEVFPDFELTGDTIRISSIIGEHLNIDDFPINDIDNIYTPILNSFDPNDKSVSPTFKDEGFVVFDTPLTYTIRFQNLGTADAKDIVIIDTINELLNLATFEIIDSSHAMTYEINGRVITFTFSDIYLPDSTTNEQGSHGFVKFKLMPKEITEENTMVSNIAYIYFDFNPAVVTNTAPSIYVSELPIDKEETNIKFLDDIALIYPNPTSDIINIIGVEKSMQLKILNIQSQKVFETVINSSHLQLNLKELALEKGIYMIQIVDKNKQLIQTEQFILE